MCVEESCCASGAAAAILLLESVYLEITGVFMCVYGIDTELTLLFVDHFLKGSTFEVFFLVGDLFGDSVGFRKYALEYEN